MFYEERMIDGVLCYRSSPDDRWRELNPRQLSAQILMLRAQLQAAENVIHNVEANGHRANTPIFI